MAAIAALVGVGATAVVVAAGHVPPAAAGSSHGASSPASEGLDVLPFPGTPDASPETDVDFPAVSPDEIAALEVVGSRTGVHAGRLSRQPAGRGTAFSPARPFALGEHVLVTATLRSAAAGTASGTRGARHLRFSFSVARPVGGGGLAQTAAPHAREDSATSDLPGTHSFVTEPRFRVPWVRMTGKDTDPASGQILLDAQSSGQNAVYILSPRGRLLWYRPTGGANRQAYGLREQRYHRQPVLTYWQGVIDRGGRGQGQDLILNRSYRVIHRITPGDGYQSQGTDQHEITLTPEGTALITVWAPETTNLTSVGGPADGTAIDYIVQEIDIATGRVVWEWHSLGHVLVANSYAHYVPGVDYDYFHMNSIQQLKDGNILISSRNTWAIYLINKKTGKIIWTLGGKHSSFRMGPHTNFEWQHDATLQPHRLLTVFDDAATPAEAPQSRALEIRLGMAKRTATLARAITHKPPVLARSQGSVQVLPNRDVFVGWGTASTFSEYAPGGKQLFSGSFRSPIQSYRTYRSPWVGHPTWAPALAVRKSSTHGVYNVYVSWNGATQVAQWRVLARRSSRGRFKRLRTVAWSSFETRMRLRTRDFYFKIQGLDGKGKPLPHGTSRAVAAS